MIKTRGWRLVIGWACCGLWVLAGCRMGDGAALKEPEASQLQNILDSHYILTLMQAPSEDSTQKTQNPENKNKEKYVFMACHIGADRKGCVNVFRNAQGEGVVLSHRSLQELQQRGEQRGVFVMSQVQGYLKALAGAAAVLSGMVVIAKTAVLSASVAMVLGTTAGTVVILHEKQLGFVGLRREQIRAQMEKSLSFVSADEKGEKDEKKDSEDMMARSAQEVLQGLVRLVPDDSNAPKVTWQPVLWGEASRSLYGAWDHVVSPSRLWPAPVRARIPDLLPLLGSLINDLQWHQTHPIHYHCLPPSPSPSVTTPVCLPLQQSWHTGGILRYVRPTAITDP